MSVIKLYNESWRLDNPFDGFGSITVSGEGSQLTASSMFILIGVVERIDKL
jgi:hypothetical protein